MPQTQTRCGSSLIKVIWYRLDCRWYGRCQTSFSSSISPQPNREASHCLANHHDLTPGVVHVPGMNGPNTRGLLGKGLSAPVTPAVFGPFMPGTCNAQYRRSSTTCTGSLIDTLGPGVQAQRLQHRSLYEYRYGEIIS